MYIVLLLLSGFFFLVTGSHFLIKSLQDISLYFKLKPLFLSLVVLGFVSSAPEWFVTITASFQNLSDAAVGNVLGSNLINLLLILSLSGLFYLFLQDEQIVRFDMPVLTGSYAVLGLFAINQTISFLEGLILNGIFFLYLFLLFKKRKNTKQNKSNLSSNFSLFKSSINIILGFGLLFMGSRLTVNSSLSLVESFGLSQRFAGIFILSLSTSLPELATSVQAAFKKEGEMALGNIIGSNIFNTLFVLGSAGLINPISFSKEIYYDYFFMLFVTLVFWFCLSFFKNIPKTIFGFFIISYFIYIALVSGVF